MGYWAIGTAFEDPDPDHIRIPPFFGGLDWGYQIGDREIGGGVVDFVVYLPGEILGIRLVTEYFHAGAGPAKESADLSQVLSLSRFMTVLDWYAQDFIEDSTGEAAVGSFIELIGGRSRMPIAVRLRRTKLGRH